jgi:formiminotetrahydrofolate cyclodeaminase
MEKQNTVTIDLDYYNKLHSLEEANKKGVFISHNIVWQPNKNIKIYHESVKEDDVINNQAEEIKQLKSEMSYLKEKLFKFEKMNFIGFKF